jgi:hypothetical protein
MCNSGFIPGAMFLQSCVRLFDSHLAMGENYGRGKEMDNIVIIIAHLCNFRVGSKLVC